MAGNIHLPYTLQTSVGMVCNSGLPARRWYPEDNTEADLPLLQGHSKLPLAKLECNSASRPRLSFREQWANVTERNSAEPPRICSYQDYAEADWFSTPHAAPIATVAISCITTRHRLETESTSDAALQRLAANIGACRNPAIDIHRLITFIRARARLDLEQAAAAVVSALVSDGRIADAAVLLRELTGVLSVADMRVPGDEALVRRNTHARGEMAAFANLAGKTRTWISGKLAATGADEAALGIGSEPPRSWEGLVRLLVRVRSSRPAEKNRCLYIPRRKNETAKKEPKEGHAEFLDGYVAEMEARGEVQETIKGYMFPREKWCADSSIVLPKHCFRVVQRRILRLFAFWDRSICLRRSVRRLEDKVLYAGGWIDGRLRETEDVALVAHWVFGFQRRLQLKVVSDDKWTRFLDKNEGATLYQNNLRLKSTFELELAKLAGQTGTETLVTGDDTLRLMDETCLLMKEYVDVYGGGKKERLVFTRGVGGGGGRGVVDEYNMLCDILKELKLRAKDEGLEKVPGPVYKFVAKDIMQWNDAWGDDAFAGGKVHGWEGWIRERGLVSG